MQNDYQNDYFYENDYQNDYFYENDYQNDYKKMFRKTIHTIRKTIRNY